MLNRELVGIDQELNLCVIADMYLKMSVLYLARAKKNSNQASKILSIIGKRIENKENHIFL